MAAKLLSWLLSDDHDDSLDSDGDQEEGACSDNLETWVQEAKQVLAQDKVARGVLGSRLHHHYALPHLLELRECVLNHRWLEALQVMTEVVKHPSYTSQAIFRVGQELFYQLAPDGSAHQEHLLNELKQLDGLNRKEVAIEQALHLLSEHKLEQADAAFTIPGQRTQPQTVPARTEEINLLFMVYPGLVYYAEWLVAKQQVDKWQTEVSVSHSAAHSDEMMAKERSLTTLAAKALDRFHRLKFNRGVWDVFIIKQVELMEYIERPEDAKEVLEEYAAKNSLNPNAHRYLYEFYNRHGYSREEKVKVLQTLVDLVPSDGLVIELYSLLQEQGAPVSHSLPVLFNLLDYAQWQHDPRPWKLLATTLADIQKRGKAQEVQAVRVCWRTRSDWWPLYQLQRTTGGGHHDDQSAEVTECKATVKAMLCSRGSLYRWDAASH